MSPHGKGTRTELQPALCRSQYGYSMPGLFPTRTCAHSLKERQAPTEDTLDLGEIRNAGGTPSLETLLHRIKYASGGFMW